MASITRRSSGHGSEPPSEEDAVNTWCYKILSSMPEMVKIFTCPLDQHWSDVLRMSKCESGYKSNRREIFKKTVTEISHTYHMNHFYQ